MKNDKRNFPSEEDPMDEILKGYAEYDEFSSKNDVPATGNWEEDQAKAIFGGMEQKQRVFWCAKELGIIDVGTNHIGALRLKKILDERIKKRAREYDSMSRNDRLTAVNNDIKNLTRANQFKYKGGNYLTLNLLELAQVEYEYMCRVKTDLLPETNQDSDIKLVPNGSNRDYDSDSKYKADLHALAYIFDLWAKNERVPTNDKEGGLSKKYIKDIGEKRGFEKPDTFYRSVKKLIEEYDLNKEKDLENISTKWLSAVKLLSEDWRQVEQYLKNKQLIKD